MKTFLFILFGSIGLLSVNTADHQQEVEVKHSAASQTATSTSFERVKNMELSLRTTEQVGNNKRSKIEGYRTRGRF